MATNLAKSLVSIILLGLALFWLDWTHLWQMMHQIHPLFLIIAFGACLGSYLIASDRWCRIIALRSRLPYRSHTKIYFYSVFLNFLTPANLGGDVYRVAVLKSRGHETLPVITALVQERAIGLFSFGCFYLLSWLGAWLSASQPSTGAHLFDWVALGGATILPMVVVGAGLLDRANRLPRSTSHGWRYKFLLASQALSLPLRLILTLVLLSLAATFLWLTTVKNVALGLQVMMPWTQLGMIVILVELVRLVPITIQGVGVREGAYAYLFKVSGYSPEAGFVVGAVSYLILGFTLVTFGCLSRLISDKPINPTLDQCISNNARDRRV